MPYNKTANNHGRDLRRWKKITRIGNMPQQTDL
jgi:hypothetical protein